VTAYSVYHSALIAQPDGCGDVQNTHHTQAHHPLSPFHTHFLSHTLTHQLLVHFMHTVMHFLNMPVVTASYCGGILPAAYPSVAAFIFFLFLVLSPRSRVSDTSPLILILSGICSVMLSLFFHVRLFPYIVTAGLGKILNFFQFLSWNLNWNDRKLKLLNCSLDKLNMVTQQRNLISYATIQKYYIFKGAFNNVLVHITLIW